MEVLLKYFFEDFSQLERDNLHARYKRRSLVEYFNTLILGCSKGEDCDPRKSCLDAISGILQFHEDSINANTSVCLMGKYHNILYIAAKLCYDWQITNSTVVSEVLKQIYRCERTFERLWVGAIFGYGAGYLIANWKSDFETPQENLRAVIYFLNHANNAKLEFCNEDATNMRFIDVPLESCQGASALEILVELGVPHIAHILIRFGAKDITCKRMLEGILSHFSCTADHPGNNRVVCLQHILRAIPRIKLKQDNPSVSSTYAFLDTFSHLVENSTVPTKRCGIEPPELKHLCRCVVRECLWKNHMLPNGIKELPIPDVLRSYLDLLVD